MQQEGFRPMDFIELNDRFLMMSSAAHKERKRAIAEAKGLSTKERGLLCRFYQECYHSPQFWGRFEQIVETGRQNNSAISSEDLAFATGFMIILLTAVNFKRAGNFSLLEEKPMEESLRQAFVDFKFRFSTEKVSNAGGRLDRQKCVPAVIDIPCSSKLGSPEKVVVLSPRDQRALLKYHKYVRPNGPTQPATTKFFVNARGRALNKDVWMYLRRVAEGAGICGITFNTLRRAIETENGVDKTLLPNSNDPDLVSNHLGHSSETAVQYYRIQDCRYAVQAANQLLLLLEEAGEGAQPLSSVKSLQEVKMVGMSKCD